MSLLDEIAAAASAEALSVSGHVALSDADEVPGAATLLLLSPREPEFWPVFTASPEYGDGAPDPLDRWSNRVITPLAERFGGQALFPFGGPPWHPFIGWALRSGRAWHAPVGLLVHQEAGLFISYRGAIALPDRHDLPRAAAVRPCETCAQPCRTACPVSAFEGDGYDVAACKGWLDRPEGAACRTGGCLVRRACPVGAGARDPAQSAFHMTAFHDPGRNHARELP